MLREFIEQIDKLPQKALVNRLEIDVNKPSIGIISAQSEAALAHNELEAICQRVKLGVVAAGGSAKIAHVPSIDTTVLNGTQGAKYDLASRDLTANAVELLCATDFYDAVVFVASEQNIVCGMLIAAIRLGIPCLFVCEGVASPIVYDNKEHGYIHFFEQVARIKSGKTAYEQMNEVAANLPVMTGTDCERYGANSFNCILEAIGCALRGNGTAPAHSAERYDIARKTGETAVKFAKEQLSVHKVLTSAMLTNLIATDLACGGCSTTMMNIIAVAKELGLRNINLSTVGDIAKSTPVLLSNEDHRYCIMPQFHRAGGVYGIMKQLADAKLINTDLTTCNGQTVSELISDVVVANPAVIRSAENSVRGSARLRVLYGNVAEHGCFVHFVKESSFTGNAKVYTNEEMAIDALLHREIRAGDVVVIRGEGPHSGPGMREIYTTLALLKGFELDKKVAVITDGRIPDFYPGIAVGHITPESNEDCTFAVIQDGDEIEISVPKGKVSCDITAKELSQRMKSIETGVGSYGNYYLKNWAKNCASASDGCVPRSKK